MPALVPSRRRGHEHLDDPHLIDGAQAIRELRDVTRTNQLFGGTAAVLAEVAAVWRGDAGRAAPLTLLDIGTGLGDIPARAGAAARDAGVALVTVGLERAESLAAAARPAVSHSVVADGFRLPFAARSIDIITCSQVLHHFAEPDAEALLRECDRVARRRVIISDLRRSWIAAGGVWLASWPLGFSRWARHDGVLSVLRGFTVAELVALAQRITEAPIAARERLGFRVTCSWTPTGSPA
jgi:SAM-dependent methyltransferase